MKILMSLLVVFLFYLSALYKIPENTGTPTTPITSWRYLQM